MAVRVGAGAGGGLLGECGVVGGAMSHGWMAALSWVGATVLVLVVFSVPLGVFLCDEVRNRWVCGVITVVALLLGMWWIAAVIDAYDSGACNAGQPAAIECVW